MQNEIQLIAIMTHVALGGLYGAVGNVLGDPILVSPQ